jgi:hypothetical protein
LDVSIKSLEADVADRCGRFIRSISSLETDVADRCGRFIRFLCPTCRGALPAPNGQRSLKTPYGETLHSLPVIRRPYRLACLETLN